jgi:hypothetical protein
MAVDHDADGLALSHCIYSRSPDTFVLVRQVEHYFKRVRLLPHIR